MIAVVLSRDLVGVWGIQSRELWFAIIVVVGVVAVLSIGTLMDKMRYVQAMVNQEVERSPMWQRLFKELEEIKKK